MQHTLWCRFNQWYQVSGVAYVGALKSMLYNNQIQWSFQCHGSNIFMQIFDDSDVKYVLSSVSSMSPNTI